MNKYNALAGLLTYSPFYLVFPPVYRKWLIDWQRLRSLQLRDSYGLTPYSLLIH